MSKDMSVTWPDREPLIVASATQNGVVSEHRANRKSVDEMLTHIEMGRYQTFLLLVLGAAYMGDSGEALIVSFLGLDVRCEWNITSVEESSINAAVFLGVATGALLFGYLGDRIGRRTTIIMTSIVTAFFGLLSATATNVWFLIICRYLAGSGLGGFPLLLSMYAEFLPIHQRGTTLAMLQLFWGGGSIMTVSMARLLLPDYHWRGLAVAAATPSVLLLMLLPFISESPRYLMVNGREFEALAVLQRVAKINGKCLPTDIQLDRVTNLETVGSNRTSFMKLFKKLFESPLHRITGILWTNWFAVAVGYYSIVMLTTTVQTNEGNEQSCVDGQIVFSDSDYRDIIIDSCADLPGIAFAVLTVEYFGRKKTLLFMWMGSALSMLLLPITSSLTTVFLFFGRFFVLGSFTVLMVVVPELYPSSCRSFAIGVGCLVSRVGAALSPFLAGIVNDAYGLPIVTTPQGILFLIISALTMCIPFETKGKSMKDTIDDVENEIRGTDHQDARSYNS